MNTDAKNTDIGSEKCEPHTGLERLLACEAHAISGALLTLITDTASGAVRTEWQQQGIVKASILRAYLNGRLPYRGMRGSDRSLRISKVFEILVSDAIMSPLSATEAINEIGEFTRNNGSFLRLLPQGLNKLARIAGERFEPAPLGEAVKPAEAAE